MLDASIEKWRPIQSLLVQYPVNNFKRQYQFLVIKRLIAANLLCFLLQYIGLMISTLLASPNPVWFATGSASAMVFLRGYRVLPGIWLGCFVTYLLASHQFYLSLACATVFALQASLLTWMTHRFINPSLIFYHANRLIRFYILSGVLTAVAAFLLMYVCHQAYDLFFYWWLANWNGVLIVAIAWVTTDSFFTYGGRSYGTHLIWCNTIRVSFMIAFVFNMLIYLDMAWILPMTMNVSNMVYLQLILMMATSGGLLIGTYEAN